jgi:hypothetical protein
MDFDFITPRLATGGQFTSEADVDQVVAAGITLVVDARAGHRDFPVECDDAALFGNHPQITYCWDPTEDDGQPKPVSWFAKALAVALPALTQPRARVLFHCSAGVNRGPSLAYAAMRAVGFGGTDAINLIHAARPVTVGGIAYASSADAAVTALGFD